MGPPTATGGGGGAQSQKLQVPPSKPSTSTAPRTTGRRRRRKARGESEAQPLRKTHRDLRGQNALSSFPPSSPWGASEKTLTSSYHARRRLHARASVPTRITSTVFACVSSLRCDGRLPRVTSSEIIPLPGAPRGGGGRIWMHKITGAFSNKRCNLIYRSITGASLRGRRARGLTAPSP